MEARFLTKVIKCENGCWEWNACKDTGGYGMIKIQKKTYLTHRIAYELWKGKIPAGQLVRHKCDVRNCVNPEHLEIGTHKDNSRDCLERNRHLVGEKQLASKLTEDDVREIRILRGFGFTLKELGNMYDVSGTTIWYVSVGKHWKHI